jgi:hypothetical protein
MSPQRRERDTGWRDLALSERHRQWGDALPAVDLDYVLVEYDAGGPVCLIEYKLGRPRRFDLDCEPSLKALARLGDRACLPVFLTWYAPACWRFWPIPLNNLARKALPNDGPMTELEYVTWLYRLRGRSLPAAVAHRLSELEALTAA